MVSKRNRMSTWTSKSPFQIRFTNFSWMFAPIRKKAFCYLRLGGILLAATPTYCHLMVTIQSPLDSILLSISTNIRSQCLFATEICRHLSSFCARIQTLYKWNCCLKYSKPHQSSCLTSFRSAPCSHLI